MSNIDSHFKSGIRVMTRQEGNGANHKLLIVKIVNGLSVHEPVINKKKKLVDAIISDINSRFEQHMGKKSVEVSEKTYSEPFGFSSRHLDIYEEAFLQACRKHSGYFIPFPAACTIP